MKHHIAMVLLCVGNFAKFSEFLVPHPNPPTKFWSKVFNLFGFFDEVAKNDVLEDNDHLYMCSKSMIFQHL